MTAAILALVLFQQQITTKIYGVEGPTVATFVADRSTTRTVRNLNGRNVPVETVEERLVTDSPGLRILERTISHFDSNGRPGPVETQRVETRTNDTSTEVLTTVWSSDINGRVQLTERSRAVTERLDGEDADTIITLERPGHTGRTGTGGTEEIQSQVAGPGPRRRIGDDRAPRSEWPVDRRRANNIGGDNIERRREQTRTSYEGSPAGKMVVLRRTVSRTTPPGPDGTIVSESDVFEPVLPGRTPSAGSPLQLTRQQIVERTRTESGAKETVSVRFADTSSPGHFGPLRKVEEIVCEGKCQPAMMK